MATRKRTAPDHSLVKSLNPHHPDTKYMGDEPTWAVQPEAERRVSTLARAFSWYNWFYGKKDAKDLLCQFLEFSDRRAEAKTVRKVPDNAFVNTFGWLARMKMRGLELDENESMRLENEVSRLIREFHDPEVKESTTSIAKVVKTKPEAEAARPNIQEIMREKARDAAGELEGILDDFVKNGKTSFKPIDVVARFNVMPQHISIITDVWKRKQEEFSELQTGKDKQLVEAYSHLSKIQVRNIVKFIDLVLSDLSAYISVKKASKAPRRRKAVPVEKIVARLKYAKTFKDDAAKLDLVSISPTKLHGASEAYLYDTAKRRLVYLVADEYSKELTVKGATILGFDASKSQTKILRKPDVQLKEFMKLGKPAGRKFYAEIKSVGTTPNGRTNDNMIILRVN